MFFNRSVDKKEQSFGNSSNFSLKLYVSVPIDTGAIRYVASKLIEVLSHLYNAAIIH